MKGHVGVGILLLGCVGQVWAVRQEPHAPAYLSLRVERYEVDVRLMPTEGRAEVRATLAVVNPSPQIVDRLALRLGSVAEVAEIRVGDQGQSFTTRKDEVTGLTIYSLALPEPVRAGGRFTLVVTYRVHAEEATPRAALTPEECVLLPESFWLPMIHTPFQVEYRVDLSPFLLSVTAPSSLLPLSSGRWIADRSEGETRTTVFEESALSQPLFIARDFERVGEGQDVEFYLPRGFVHGLAETRERIREEIARIREFYAAFFGFPVARPIRVVASTEVPAYGAPGLLIFDERVFARRILDEETFFFVAAQLARLWMGARVEIQGAGHAVLDHGLPSYLAFLYMEHRFGALGRQRAIERFRRAYATLVTGGSAYDVPLLRQTLMTRQYYTSIFNKTPMVLRLLAHQMGRESFHALLREFFARPEGRRTFEDFRQAVVARAPADLVKGTFDQWFAEVVLPDFAVGRPVAEGGEWTVQVANFGSGEAVVEVEVVTTRGERARQAVRVEAQGYGQARFRLNDEPIAVAVDPEHLYLQADYTNDVWPRPPLVDRLVSQGTLALAQGKASEAEAALRQALAHDPERPLAHAALARALALVGKGEEAESHTQHALAQEPLTLAVYAWAQMALGEVALGRGQAERAIEYFRQASFSFAEDISLLMARDALIRAEQAARSLSPGDRSVAEFIARLDSVLSSGRPAAVREIVTPQNLRRFITGASFLKEWKSEILRAEALDRNRVLVDVRIAATTVGGTHRTSRALYVVRRAATGWVLDDIPVFLER